jgi:hypothetical protein
MRFVAVIVGTAAVIAVAAPGLGATGGSGKRPKQECGRIEFTSALEVVFARFDTEAAADTYRGKIQSQGFQNANVIQGCDGFRVVVRGMDDFDTAVALQTEARHGSINATVECVKGKDDIGELEVVFGHRRDRDEARQLVSRAASSGFVGRELQPDPSGGGEGMLKGFSGRAEAEDFVSQAKKAGFDAVIERS